jgi:hypothetical protein
MADNPERIIIGSTLDNQKTTTPFLDTDKIRLVDDIVLGITHDPDVTSQSKIPSSSALWNGLRVLREQLHNIDPNNIAFKDHSVVSLSLINPILKSNNDDITFRGWDWGEDDKYLYTIKEFGQNAITIPNTYLSDTGYYFLIIHVRRLDSGRLSICVNGTEQAIITTTGIKRCEIFVTNPNTENITIEAKYITNVTHITEISYLSIHRVYDRIRYYIEYLVGLFGVGGQWATQEYVQNLFETFKNEINQDSVLSKLLQDFNNHITSTNPHGITPTLINASEKNHTHQPWQVGAAPTTHTHTPQECGAAPTAHTHLPSECGSSPIDHTHTPDQCGASPVNHTHTPISIGAANSQHTHTPEECGSQPVGDYVTKDQIQGQINYVNTTITNIEQKLNDITSIAYVLYNSIKGKLPTWLNHNVITYPSFVLRSGAYITHIPHPKFNKGMCINENFIYNKSSYNYGNINIILSPNTQIINEKKIGGINAYGFQYDSNYIYITSSIDEFTTKVIIEFPYKLTLKSYTIYTPPNFEKPIKWIMHNDQDEVVASSEVSTLDYNNNKITVYFSQPVTTTKIIWYITKISKSYSSYNFTNIYSGIIPSHTYITAFKIYFWEEGCNPNDQAIKIVANPHTFLNNLKYDINDTLTYWLDLTQYPEDIYIPYYFYIEKDNTNNISLKGTPIPPEFDNHRTGTLFHYNNDSRYIINNQNDDHLKFTETCTHKTTPLSIFEDEWEVESGQLESTLTLNFDVVKNIPRIKFIFTQDQVDNNYIPDYIKIESISSVPNLIYDPPILIPIVAWHNSQVYDYGSLAIGSDNQYYYSKSVSNTNHNPVEDLTNVYWNKINNIPEEYDLVQVYTYNDVVIHNDKYYLSLSLYNINNDPSNPLNSNHWQYLSNVQYIVDTTPTIEDNIRYINFSNLVAELNPMTNQYEYTLLFNENITSSLECKTLKITIHGTKLQPALAVHQVHLYFSQDILHLPDMSFINELNQETQFKYYLGYGYIYKSSNNQDLSYVNLYPIQIGRTCIIPVNDYTNNTSTFVLNNPYMTKYISCKLLELDMFTQDLIEIQDISLSKILQITDDYIKVQHDQNTMIFIAISRQW